MRKTMFEKKFDEGIAVGEARGEARGKAEAVLKIIRKKFMKVPKHIEQAILTMSDPIALESLLEHAIDSETLDEFGEVL